MATAPVPRATGSSTDSAGRCTDAGSTAGLCAVEAAAAAAAAASWELRVPSAGEGAGRVTAAASTSTSPGRTRVPTPPPAGVAKPQSSSRSACSVVDTGYRSVCMRLTTSRRPSRSAAATKVCRAASVKPVLPPSVPG